MENEPQNCPECGWLNGQCDCEGEPPVRSSELVQPARPATFRNRRRYDAYLRMAEVAPDLTFREWLTSPLYKERRESCG